jgi:hypothetical protein
MNERIKELAREAGLLAYNPEGLPTKLEKFAELIVRECADIATINQHQWHSAGSYVLKHFGVAE